jgi:Protein of unknown function (DUF1573)
MMISLKNTIICLSIFFGSFAFISCTNTNEPNKQLQAKAAADSSNYTQVQWLDTVVNIGQLKMGEKKRISFTCLNTGTKPLIITNARPGCGCTVADYTKEPIAPGQKGEVIASFDSNKVHGGDIHKSIVVTTNTTNGTEHILTFKGSVLGAPNDVIAVPKKVSK